MTPPKLYDELADWWLRILAEVGFEAERVSFVHSEVSAELDVFVGRRRVATPCARV